MSASKRWVGAVVMALAGVSAQAGTHQICYEGMPQRQGAGFVSTGVFACAVDGGGRCTINPLTTAMTPRPSAPLDQAVAVPGATFAYYNFQYSTGYTYGARFEFWDAGNNRLPDRTCSVYPYGVHVGIVGNASPGAVLTGFSTDASGLATTGVWRLQATADGPFRSVEAIVPADFVIVGGGAMGVEAPNGAVVFESRRLSRTMQRSWVASTSEASNAAQLHRTTAYAIGLRIEGVDPAQLTGLVQELSAGSGLTPLAHPTAQVMQPVIGGSVILSGGIAARADPSNALNQIGQFATRTAPVIGSTLRCTQDPNGAFHCTIVPAPVGWAVESKDHVVAHPGSVSTQMLALPTTITVGSTTWEVRSGFVSATSPLASHPAIEVSGLRGDYALTGIGATVNWKRFDTFGNQVAMGNLLWKLEPRADLGGASVASKDHVLVSPATITGFAVGIKLVAPGTP